MRLERVPRASGASATSPGSLLLLRDVPKRPAQLEASATLTTYVHLDEVPKLSAVTHQLDKNGPAVPAEEFLAAAKQKTS